MENLSLQEKMKGMNFKQKIEYILYYYKFHITIIIVIITILASISINFINRKDSILNIILIGTHVDLNKQEEIRNEAENAIIKSDRKKKEIGFEFLQTTNDPQAEMNSIASQKLTALIAAGDVDILILDKNDFDTYVRKGMFMKLTSIPHFSDIHVSESALVKGKIDKLDKEDKIYGINVEKIQQLKKISYDSKNKVLCIVSNSKHGDSAIEFLKWVYLGI